MNEDLHQMRQHLCWWWQDLYYSRGTILVRKGMIFATVGTILLVGKNLCSRVKICVREAGTLLALHDQLDTYVP